MNRRNFVRSGLLAGAAVAGSLQMTRAAAPAGRPILFDSSTLPTWACSSTTQAMTLSIS